MSRVGRPRKLDYEWIKGIVVLEKDQLVTKNSLVSKSYKIWETVGRKVNMTATSLYAHVANNKGGIKDELIEKPNNASMTSVDGESFSSNEKSINVSIDETEVDLYLSQVEFKNLLETRTYTRKEAKRCDMSHRSYQVFAKDRWQTLMIQRLYEKGIKCGFQFQTHKIYPTSDTASFQAKCICGSSLRGQILTLKTEVVRVTCFITKGTTGELCGKRQLRGEIRREVAEHLIQTGQGGAAYRVEQAGHCMKLGDRREPAFLPPRTVLNQAKSELVMKEVVHPDAVQALRILQTQKLKCTLQNIGAYPFFVHYFDNSQLNSYRSYATKVDHPTIVVDATGGCVKKVEGPDKSKSQHIFLYECVVNTGTGEEYSQFPVTQMLSARQATNNIIFWLLEWKKFVPPPHEAVSDSCKALSLALINVFTRCKTIIEYCNSCMNGPLPDCYVRIDVAHTMKIYSEFLKNKHQSIRNLYLGAVGLLIMAESLKEAERILRLLLTVCRSEYQGPGTICSDAKQQMKALLIKDPGAEPLLTGNEDVDNVLRSTRQANFDAFEDLDDIAVESSCYEWARAIDDEVKATLDLEGEDANAHMDTELADKIVKHCATIVMWSCVVTDKFGFGRKPASSAPVESEFGNLKNRVFKGRLPMRADLFVERHADYIQNRGKLISVHEDLEPEIHQNLMSGTQSNGKDQPINGCRACRDGNPPGGAHKCVICGKAVHLIDGCSSGLPGEEEGHGETRICAGCSKMGPRAVSEILGSREVENWGGFGEEAAPALITATSSALEFDKEFNLHPADDWIEDPTARADESTEEPVTVQATGSPVTVQATGSFQDSADEPPEKRARYVKGRFNEQNFVLHSKLKNLPCIQNGNLLGRMPVAIAGQKYTVRNTCAFDSLFQLAFIANKEEPFLPKVSCDIFLEMVTDVNNKGITLKIYKNRARLLMNDPSSTVREISESDFHVLATSNIGDLAERLFANVPSMVMTKTCSAGCTSFDVECSVLTMTSEMNIAQIDAEISAVILQKCQEEPCKFNECGGKVSTQVSNIGPMILLDITPGSYTIKKVKLKDLPKTITVSTGNNEYSLAGVVHYDAPRYARKLSENDIGHYKTYSRMPNGAWYESDDVKQKVIRVNYKTVIVPSIILFKSRKQTI